MFRRFFAAALALLLTFGLLPAIAQAQSDTGEIDIVVQLTGTKKPVVMARVLLDGPVVASEFTGNDGRVKFTDVPDGIYRARVFSRGYQAVTSANFEVTEGRVVTVTVALAQSNSNGLKTIATEVVHSSAVITTSSISSESAQRKLSDTLADALGKLSGVNLTTSSNDSDATQTISLEGQDPSQTAMTLDGIPLGAPGSAVDMRSVSSDLFTGAGVSFGPQIGGLAGGVNFRTLEPTISWQSAFSLSVGSNGKNNYSLSESGSLGKFGFAAMHTYRAVPSLLDGMQFLDTSGLFYEHEGDRDQIGTMLKMRYQMSESQTLTGMYLHSVNGSQLVCTQDTGPLPCGYGPGNGYNTTFNLYSLTDNALIGDTQVTAAFFGSNSNATHDLTNLYVNGEAAPTGTISSSSFNGFSASATLPARERHTISVNAYGVNSSSTFTPLVPEAAPYTFPGQTASYGAITVNDAIRSNPKLRFNDSIGISRASNSGGSLLAGVSANWQPSENDGYAFSYNLGGVAPHASREGFLTQPDQLRFDCNGDVAYGGAPGDQPGASSSTSARFSYTHKLKGGLISASLYRQVQNGTVLPVQVNGSALVPSGIFPFGYFQQAQTTFNQSCGLPLVTPFGPQNTYFSTPVGNVQRVYQGFQLVGFFTLGNLVAEPYYDTQAAIANSTDPRIDNPYSITISGAQLPNVPLHRGGLTLDYKAPHSIFEWLADANYTSGNNSQNLPAYTTFDAGVNAQLKRGALTFAASNITNAYAGIFSSSQWAVPYRTVGGLTIPTIARPNTPRQISLTYTVKFGQGIAQNQNTGRAIGAGGPRGGGRGGFGRFMQPLPVTPPADPFALNTSPLCTAEAQKSATAVLGALKAYAARIEAARTPAGYPATMPPAAIPGLSVTYHGLGTSYALSISVQQGSMMRTLFGCTQFHVTDEQTAKQRDLYIEPNSGPFFRPSVTFMPSVGFYFVRGQPRAGAESFRVYKLPTTPPTAPFTLRTASSSCTAPMRALAQTLLTQLQAHFASNAAAPGWTIAPHASKSGTYYELQATDAGAIPALINCGRVAAASKDDLTKLGWDGAAIPAINYAQPLGLYIVTGARGFPGERRRPEASPSPSPSS